MTISQEDFNRQCLAFIENCRNFDDNWNLMRCSNKKCELIHLNDNKVLDFVEKDQLMLIKNEPRISESSGNMLLNCEYTVIYSESYNVPVMYFTISDQSGLPLEVEECITLPNPQLKSQELASIINQVEHPYLFRPFYMIHPCKTVNFMQEISGEQSKCCTYLTSWLSTVATLIGLRLNDNLALNKK